MSEIIDLEQAILHSVLINPDGMATLCTRMVPDEFSHPVHQRIAEHLGLLFAEGREPSIAALYALFADGEEVEPGLRARDYLGKLVQGGTAMCHAPMRDLFETWQDLRTRAALAGIGGRMQLVDVMPGVSVRQTITEAIDELNDLQSSLTYHAASSYSSQDSLQSAFDAMLGEAEPIITTGLVDLDHMLGGWRRGELTIVAGRPAMGKSTFGISTAWRTAKAGHGVAMFSLEMNKNQIGSRIMADRAYSARDWVAYEDIMNRRVTNSAHIERLKQACKTGQDLSLQIDETRGLSMAVIAARAKKMARAFERKGQRLDVLMVDHIGLVKPSSRYAGNRHREIAEITDGLATLAKELDCAVVGLCQLNRGVEGRDNKRPTLSDLRDSGSIEEDASAVVFLYRMHYYASMQGQLDDHDKEMVRQQVLADTRNDLELVIAKNRNGRTGIVRVFAEMGANALRNKDFGGH